MFTIKEYYKPRDVKLIFLNKLQAPVPTPSAKELERPPAVVRVEAPDPVFSTSEQPLSCR